MRLIDADAIIEVMQKCAENPENKQALLDECLNHYEVGNIEQNCTMDWICKTVRNFPAASPWHRVEEPPKESGEYIVAYHPCYWEDVDTSVTKVGIDNFRGKSAWAKKKFQRVTHWMDKPEPPKEDA